MLKNKNKVELDMCLNKVKENYGFEVVNREELEKCIENVNDGNITNTIILGFNFKDKKVRVKSKNNTKIYEYDIVGEDDYSNKKQYIYCVSIKLED